MYRTIGSDVSFWQYKVYADIRGDSLEMGASNDSGVIENVDSSVLSDAVSSKP